MAILGIDEVGRGPLAGPLVVGAVILPSTPQPWFCNLKDSKKLTATKRAELSDLIQKNSATGLGWVSASELDQIGISKALAIATRRAVQSVQQTHTPFSQIIIDGKVNFLKHTPLEKYVSTLIKADNLIHEVSAASIIAKVARDNYMIKLASKYPLYGFEHHVGYGTAKHIKAINQYGLTPEHRQSFEPCKTLIGFETNYATSAKNTTKVGQYGEDAVAEHLCRIGHTIIERNHKTYFYEIDIISIKNDYIYFTEVKYRKKDNNGDGLAAITAKKQQQMAYAAQNFLKFQPKYKNLNPLLAVASVSGANFVVENWFPLV